MFSTPRTWVACIVLLATAASASAQGSRPGRPFRGLFGGDNASWEQTLAATASLSAGYDTALPAEGGLGFASETPVNGLSGSFAAGSTGLSYNLNRQRLGIGASVATSLRYYPDLANKFGAAHSGIVDASFRLTENTQVSISESAGYQRVSVYSLLPRLAEPTLGALPVPDYDFTSSNTAYLTTQTAASISHSWRLSRRSTLSGSYSYQLATLPDEYGNYSSHTLSGRFTRELAKGFGVRIGYGATESRYGSDRDRRLRSHNIDSGVDYNRALSISRRTKLSVATGAMAFGDGNSTTYRAVGSANLTHEIGRTWNLSAAYNRSLGFVRAFDTPFFYDALSAGLTGLITRRLSFHSTLGYSLGQSGVDDASGPAGSFDTLLGNAGVSSALTRHLAVSVEYLFYRYDFGSVTGVPVDFAPELGRHSIRVGLSVWAPLLNKGRRSDASR